MELRDVVRDRTNVFNPDEHIVPSTTSRLVSSAGTSASNSSIHPERVHRQTTRSKKFICLQGVSILYRIFAKSIFIELSLIELYIKRHIRNSRAKHRELISIYSTILTNIIDVIGILSCKSIIYTYRKGCVKEGG